MESTQQPSTIGAMAPEHFQTFIIDIIKPLIYQVVYEVVHEIVDPRFEAIEKRLNNIDERLTSLEDRFDRLERSHDLMGALLLKHDSKLRDTINT